MLNMLTTQFSLLELMILSAVFYIFSNTWQHELVFSSMDLNVNSSQSMHLFQFPSPLSRIQTHNATALIVLPSSLLLRTYPLLMSHSPHRPVPNISVPSSLRLHLPLQTLTFVVLKPPPPSRHSIHSSDILSFLSDLDPGSTPKSSTPSYSTAQNLKSTPLHKLQKLIASIVEPFAKFSKFRLPTKNRVLSPSDSPCSNEFLLSLAYLVLPACIPSSMRISDSRIKYHILRHPDSAESIIMFNPSHSLTISSPFRRGAPSSTLSPKRHIEPPYFTTPHFLVSHTLKQRYNTSRFLRLFLRIAENREQWTCLAPKLK